MLLEALVILRLALGECLAELALFLACARAVLEGGCVEAYPLAAAAVGQFVAGFFLEEAVESDSWEAEALGLIFLRPEQVSMVPSLFSVPAAAVLPEAAVLAGAYLHFQT